MSENNREAEKPMDATDLLIAALEGTIKLLKEIRDGWASASRIDEVICQGEAAICDARRGERENAVMIKPQPRGVRIDGWDV